jgi:hypothetical protein
MFLSLAVFGILLCIRALVYCSTPLQLVLACALEVILILSRFTDPAACCVYAVNP